VPKLVLEGLRRLHPGARSAALDDVSLDVGEGESLVLVGPSGCGKSTLLRLVAGLDEPSAGRILLGGRDLARVPPQDRDVAMVFQGYALYPHLTARQNLEFPLRMRKIPPKEREAAVSEAAALLSIERLLDRLPSELSGGERQRVAMGRAIVRRPKLFLFDEPLANLDAALRTTLRVELAELLRRLGATSLYVTHDQVEAMTVGHRVAVMRAGKVEQLGPPRSIYEAPKTLFVAGFLGSPPINAWPALSSERGATLGRALVGSSNETRSLVVAARPEHVQVTRGSESLVGDASDDLELEAEVVAIEALGSETVVHARGTGAAKGLEIRSKKAGFCDFSPGEAVVARVPRTRVALFLQSTGERLEDGARLEGGA
jgi:multiple sugar transport system ATP-binding protein